MHEGVFFDFLRSISLAIPTHIESDPAITCVTERPQLMPPRILALGKAVTEDHHGSAAGLSNVNAMAAHLDRSVGDVSHLLSRG